MVIYSFTGFQSSPDTALYIVMLYILFRIDLLSL